MFASYPKYSQMLSQTEANYKTAQAYYAQKETAFRQALAKNSGDIYGEYINSLINESKNFNTYVLERAREVIEKGSYSQTDRSKDGTYSVYIAELFNTRSRGEGGKSWINMKQAGYTFERFMYNRAMSAEQAQRLKNMPKAAADECMTQWLNTHKEFAATTGVRTFGRSDLAFGKKVTSGTKTELVNWIDLETTPPAGVTTGDFLLQSVIDQGIEQNVYGFQLKTYKENADDKRWQNSKVLADQITALMHDRSRKRTWSANYAVNYPIYVLSKYLINIINPINVATITPSGLEYTTEMLAKYRFYMEVSWNEPTSPSPSTGADRGGGDEVYPSIINKTVLMRLVGSAGGWQGLRATGKLKQSAGYDKSIRVASIRNG